MVTSKDRNPSPSTTTTLKYYDVQQSRRLFLAHIRVYNNALALASIGCKGHGRLFLAHIRKYNNALALASIGCKGHVRDGLNPTFTIQGKLYHRMGNRLSERGETPKFSQIYFYDSDIDTEVNYRLTHAELDRHILQELHSTLHSVNSYVKSFKTAIEVGVEQPDVKLVSRADKKPPQGGHARTYNLPASIKELRRISTCHRLYDPLQYVLLFPTGCDGWHLGLKKTDNKTLTAVDFYKSRLQIRNNDFNIMSRMKKLTQQYAVDQWAKIEAGHID